jgi:uncharacterized protein (DUF433 family)
LDNELREKLAVAAARKSMTFSALVERVLQEGLIAQDHPGIIFNDGPSGRRAAVVGTGADVWEIISTWRYLGGTEAERRAALESDYGLKKWQINAALDYFTAFPKEVEDRIDGNQRAMEEFDRRTAERSRLLA